MPIDPRPLLPLRAVELAFVFTAKARLRFFHQPLAAALLRHLMHGQLKDEPRLWLETPESGRVPFARGDGYRLRLWCARGAEHLLQQAVERLRRLPEGAPDGLGESALGPNLRFESARDHFTDEPYAGVARLHAYDADDLAAELDLYAGEPQLNLRWLAPARLLRHKSERGDRRNDDRFAHNRGELVGELLGMRLDDSLRNLLRAFDQPLPPRGPSGIQVSDDDIGWYDGGYADEGGRVKPNGGLVGACRLTLTDPAALPGLIVGQYLGIGQLRTFGLGRYRLETLDGRGTLTPRHPSRPVLSRAADAANVELAYYNIRANQRVCAGGERPPRRDPIDEDIADLAWVEHPGPTDRMLEGIAAGLREGSWRPQPLQGFVLRRPGKSPRPLAVPPFPDRVAQRAVMQVLSGDLAPLWSAGSYGYRRGVSREQARDRLQALYRQGWQWLYEADIDDFFDSVPHPRLATRLASLLPDDPVIELLLGWMAAPVEFYGRRVERHAGLPQGAPLSPLLANLMLEDFDADLESLGFKLVRYADDFVIACKSREQAEAAARRVHDSLAEIDLRINQGKSRITHFDQGFRFLGYSFLGDLAVDGAGRGGPPASGKLLLKDLPPASWLAELARREPEILEDVPPPPPAPQADPGGPTHLRDSGDSDEPTTLLVISHNSRVSTEAGRIRVANADGQVHQQPWHGLGAVLLLGRQRITGPAMTAALAAGVPIHFAGRGGRWQGVLADHHPGPGGPGLWLEQERRFTDPELALELARELVAARIHNQRHVLRQRERHEPALHTHLRSLSELRPRVAEATGLAQLNGIEGLAARHYFQGIALLLPEDFSFRGRERRPPPDPFNALLSLGYTLLHQRSDCVVRAAGLWPWRGFYHQAHGRHESLASDLMEPFRHLVERQALSMIKRGELVPEDFYAAGQDGCRLRRPALRSYVSALSDRFLIPMEDAAGTGAAPLHEHQWRMARALVGLLQGRAETFVAFRIKS